MFFFSSRRRHTRWPRDWSSDVCSSDLSFAADTDSERVKSGEHVSRGHRAIRSQALGWVGAFVLVFVQVGAETIAIECKEFVDLGLAPHGTIFISLQLNVTELYVGERTYIGWI